MENKSHLVDYTLFRLAVFMAAGIFFFDSFLPDMSVWPLLFVLFVSLFILLLSSILKFKKNFLNYSIGFVISACFFLIGGILVILERNNIEYEWDNSKSCYYGVVETSPEVKGKTLCSEVKVEAGISPKGDVSEVIDRNILLYFIPDSSAYIPRCGDNIVFYSSISKPVSDSEFMGFDYSRYLFTKGISGTAFAFSGNWKAVDVEHPSSIRHTALRCREAVSGIFRSWEMDDDVLAVVSALTIGDKSELTQELKAVYSAAGTSHVLALSGLHVGILSGILYLLLWPLRKVKRGRIIQSFVVAAALWIFAFISGLSPSVVRAVTMCTLYLVASVLVENGFCGFFSLSLTAFIMLLYNPLYLFDISFQLSFIAVLSIILFFPVISVWVKSGNRIIGYVWNVISVSIAAQLGTLPLILYYFGTFPTYFLMANLLVAPLAIIILSLTLASLLLSFIPVVGEICISLLEMFTMFLNSSMQFVQSIRGAQITSVYFNELQVLLAFMFLASLYMFFRKRCAAWLIKVFSIVCLLAMVEVYKMRTQEGPSLFFARSDLYIRNGKELESVSSDYGLHEINGVKVGVMKSAYWKNICLTGETKLASLDYVYICRGFSGNITHLLTLFDIKNVVIDGAVSERYREFLKEECVKLNIRCIENSAQASYRILL